MVTELEWFSEKAKRVNKRYKWCPWTSPKRPKRAILKNGTTNVFRTKLAKEKRWRYVQDIFTTLLDAQWRWTALFIGVQFFGTWLIFALIWWLIAFVHGDLHEDHLPLRQPETGWNPCVLNIHGFHSCFLYSLETQHTTGYGLRAITEECPEAIFILCCQCTIGIIIDSFTIGIVFAKMARSKLATRTIQFSRNAVVSRRDDKLCLMFRVGDIRRSRLVGVGVRAILVVTKTTQEGEMLGSYQEELLVKADGGDSSLFMLWPLVVFHEIDENSPLQNLTSPEKMKTQKVEIIVIISATVESTGASVEARSSYLACEILWNRRFESVVSFNRHIFAFEIDWDKFDSTLPTTNSSGEIEDEEASLSDDQETVLLNDNPDPGCSFDYNPTWLPLSHEMINFEDNEMEPYKKPMPPATGNKRTLLQRQLSKYDNYPETIDESDEYLEMKTTDV